MIAKGYTYATYLLLICGVLLGAFPRAIAGFKPHELLLVCLAGVLFIWSIVQQKPLQVTLLDGAFLLILFAGSLLPLLTMEIRGYYITSDAVKSLLAPVEYYLWYRVFMAARLALPDLTRLILILLTINSLGGDLQALHFPGITSVLNIVSSTHQASISASVARPTGFVGEWGLLASLAGFALLLLNQLLTSGEQLFGQYWRRWFLGMLVINVFALVATLAVEGFIALLIGYGVAYSINQRRLARETWLGLGIAASSLLVITPALFLRLQLQFGVTAIPATWQVRFLHWQIVLASIWANPATVLFGVNPSFLYPVVQFGGTESLYWLLWYRGGVFYLLAFLTFLGCIIKTTWQTQHDAVGFERAVLLWIFTVYIVISIIGSIDALFVDGGEVQLLMTLVAILGSARQVDTASIVKKGKEFP